MAGGQQKQQMFVFAVITNHNTTIYLLFANMFDSNNTS